MRKYLCFLLFFYTAASFAGYSSLIDATGNDYLRECNFTEKDFSNEISKAIKNKKPNYEILLTQMGCATTVATSFRTVTEVAYRWLDIDYDCYYKYYSMDHFSFYKISAQFLKYVKEHPEARNLGTGMLMAGMLNDYYPAPKECFKHVEKSEKK